MRLEIECDWCCKKIYRFPSVIKKHNFCSKQCLAKYSSKSMNPERYRNLKDYTNISANMSRLNITLNPTRMTPLTRYKLRLRRLGTGKGKTYEKFFGVHTHRIKAEALLKRKLRSGEVVHHIDGNKRNNSFSNLRVFKNQSLHAKWHARNKAGGDKK